MGTGGGVQSEEVSGLEAAQAGRPPHSRALELSLDGWAPAISACPWSSEGGMGQPAVLSRRSLAPQ